MHMTWISASAPTFALFAALTLSLALPAGAEPLGPTAPSNLAAAPGIGEATLSWDAASSLLGVGAYRVYRAADDGSYALLAEVAGDQLAYTDVGLGHGATHTYVVTAVDLLGEGPASEPVSVTTYAPPTAPLGLAATPGPGPLGEASLSWSPPESDGGLPVTSYTIYRDGVPVATLDAGTTSWSEAGLTPFHAYSYAVSGTNAVGEGPRSDVACAMASPWTGFPGAECVSLL